MTSFDLRRLKLRPGDEHREALEVELPAFEFGGQRYLPVPELVPAELTVTRALTGTLLAARRSRPGSSAPATAASATRCSRCRSTRPSTRPPRPTTTSSARPTSIDHNTVEVSALGARRRRARAARQDPLPRRLRRPLPRVRQEPERRAARARRGHRRPALGAPSKRCARTFSYAVCRSWLSRRGKRPSPGATSAGQRTASRPRG